MKVLILKFKILKPIKNYFFMKNAISQNPQSHFFAGVSAYIIWGFATFPFKALGVYGSGQVLFFRVVLALVFLFTLLLTVRKNAFFDALKYIKNLSKDDFITFLSFSLLGGLLLTSNWVLYMYVLNNISLQTASFAYVICPLLTVALANIFLKEELSNQKWFGIALGGVSCVILATGNFLHLVYSILIALTYACYVISQSKLKNIDRLTLLAVQLSLAFVCIAPFGSILGVNFAMLDINFWVICGILSAFFTILPLFLNLYGLQGLPANVMGVLMYINPIINFILAFGYFGETASTNKIIAYIFIFLSVLVYNFPNKKN